ncbi:hypothetical protein AA313_de0204988 [Arthrobotrys entomopaga]|nr:hypothetical protein AA313_de0204988 [Arthrobotrys entomopaga]
MASETQSVDNESNASNKGGSIRKLNEDDIGDSDTQEAHDARYFKANFIDCIVYVGYGPSKVKILAHRHILANFSVNLKREFEALKIQNGSKPHEVDLRHVSFTAFDSIMSWCYQGPLVQLSSNASTNVAQFEELLDITHKYFLDMQELKKALFNQIEGYFAVSDPKDSNELLRLANILYKHGGRLQTETITIYVEKFNSVTDLNRLGVELYSIKYPETLFFKDFCFSLIYMREHTLPLLGVRAI